MSLQSSVSLRDGAKATEADQPLPSEQGAHGGRFKSIGGVSATRKTTDDGRRAHRPAIQAALDELRAAVAAENWIPEPTTGCWLWMGATAHKGYGQVYVGGGSRRRTMAHRAVFQALRGELIPPTLDLDHRCRNSACVNPAHLEPVTPVENVRRGGLKARATCMKRGHDLSKPNARYRRPNGDETCRECLRIRDRIQNIRQPHIRRNGRTVRLPMVEVRALIGAFAAVQILNTATAEVAS